MLLKSLFKNPILSLGFLMFALFLLEAGRRGMWDSDRFNTSSCHGALPLLKKKLENKGWSFKCNKNNLLTSHQIPQNHGITKEALKRNILNFSYKEMANNLKSLSLLIPLEFRSKIDVVTFNLIIPKKLEIRAVTEGIFLEKIANEKDKYLLAQILKESVQVQERWY